MNSRQGKKNGEEEKKKKEAGLTILFVLLSFAFVTVCLIGAALESPQPSEHIRSWTNDQIAEHAGKSDKCITHATERVLTHWDATDIQHNDGLTSDVLGTLIVNGKNAAYKTYDELGLPAPSLGDVLWACGEQNKATPYCVGAAPTFDTGQPENPYPSIFGAHNGIIKSNQTIIVSKLYTYPCTGTGGHTEYMKIWNSSDWNVTARWDGYSGDWHNLSFDNSFTLEEGETYNYTIRTGSYPQIHHIDNLSTSAGFITCSEFVDANGKVYTNWIPAIRLE